MEKRQPDRKKRIQPQNGRPTIGLLLANIMPKNASNLWHGVVDSAQKQNINLITFIGGALRSPHGFEAQANVLYDLVSADRMDGLIIWASHLGHHTGFEAVNPLFERYPGPIVAVEAGPEGIPRVEVDFYQAMRHQIVHLIEGHGYRRIAFVRGPDKTHPDAHGRYQAYLDVLAEYDIPFDPELVSPLSDKWSHSVGKEAISLLIDQRQVDFEAVVGANDELAIGAMKELQTRGVYVPDDVAVVGFDDTADSRFAIPPLTTISLQAYEQGRQAAEMLLALIEGKEVPERVTVPLELVIRQSCGCSSPTVMQAEAEPVMQIETGASFETALVTHRKDILAEMVQAAEASVVVLDSDWAEQLLDGFVAELKGASPGIFLRTLDKILRQVVAADGDVTAWYNVLSALRRYTRPYFGNNGDLSQAEDLWGQAVVMIGGMMQRVQTNQRLQAEQHAQTLRRISQALITTFDTEELMGLLVKELPQLGISSCYLSFYENLDRLTESAWLALAYDEKGRVEWESGRRSFLASQLVPEGILSRDRSYSFVVQPLYFREDQLGFVLFEVGPREGTIYETLRSEISSALQGALLVERRKKTEEAMIKRATELELVARVGVTASTILDTTQLLERVTNLTKETFGLYHAHIYLLDEARNRLVLVAGAGSVGQQMVAEEWSIPYAREQSVVVRVARMRQGIIINDVLSDPHWLPHPLLPYTRSELAVPLLVGERVVGVLDVQADEADYFAEDDIRVQTILAAQVAVALENARLFEQEQENLAFTERLYQAGRRITAANDLQKILATVAEVIPTEKINRVVLWAFEYDVSEALEGMIVRANWHSGQGTTPVAVGTRYQRTMYPGIEQFVGLEPMIFSDIQHDKRLDATLREMWQWLNVRGMVVFPLWVGARQTGVLLLQAEEVVELSEEQIRPYVPLMGQVAVAVENQRLLAETQTVLAELEATQRRYTIQAWEAYWARHEAAMKYEETREGIMPLGEELPAEAKQVIAEKQTVVVDASAVTPSTNGEEARELLVRDKGIEQAATGEIQSSLVVPLAVRDAVIGVLGVQEGDERAWAPEEIAIVKAIGEQLAQALENLRLIDETQQQAARETRINEIGAKIQEAQSLEEALKVAIKEVGLNLKAPQTTVDLKIKGT